MKVLKFLDAKLEEYLMTVLTIVMTALIFLQVVMRYIFKDSPAWTEELSRYLFLWAIWIGASYGVKTQSHVRLTVLTSRLSKKVQDVINVVVWFLWLAFTIFLVTKGFELVSIFLASGQTSTAMHIPMWIAYASVSVGCTLMAFRLLQNAYFAIRNYKKEKEAD